MDKEAQEKIAQIFENYWLEIDDSGQGIVENYDLFRELAKRIHDAGYCKLPEGEPPLKLFVWEDVLQDYTSGLVVVLAHSEQEARKVMKRDLPGYVLDQLGFEGCKIVIKPIAVYVYGGG